MSFSSSVKEEILNCEIKPRHCNLAFLSAILYTTDLHYENDLFSINFDNQRIALHIAGILKHAFGFEPKFKSLGTNKIKGCCIEIPNLEIVKNIFSATGYTKAKQVNPLVLKKDCCKKHFLSGAFFTSGSVSDPNKAYHLEFVFHDSLMAQIISDTANYFGLFSKIIRRKSNYIVYLKESDQIVDMLNITGAHTGLLEFENIRILKDIRNNVNRAVNCETFNLKKTANAASGHINNIEFIIQTKGLSFLPDELQETAIARLDYPECALKELGEKLNPPVSKSCINHRLRKISIIADGIRGGL